MRNPIPRVVTIHDISGIGRTSLTAAIPVLSSMGIQPVPLPTAVLSTQTVGTTGFTFLDLTQNMKDMLDHWIARGDRFEGVYSGFMACPDQMDTVARCIETCMLKGGLAVVDPVLGEDGQLIPTMTADMVRRMRWLIGRADVITPNYTEVCLLLDVSYDREPDMDLLKGYLRELSLMGPGVVVGTSMPLTKIPSANGSIPPSSRTRKASTSSGGSTAPTFPPIIPARATFLRACSRARSSLAPPCPSPLTRPSSSTRSACAIRTARTGTPRRACFSSAICLPCACPCRAAAACS